MKPITAKWNYLGDINMLDYGGKNTRCIGNRRYQIVELTNMDEVCGEDNAGQSKYIVELRLVDLNIATASNIKSALECCGMEKEENMTDDILAECLNSYGLYAPLESFNGNNALKLLRKAYKSANDLLDPDNMERAMRKPVNKLGSTAHEFMVGDLTSALQRGCESGSQECRIMAKIYGVPKQAIDDALPKDFLPYFFGYVAGLNDSPKETDPDTCAEYFRGYERGQNVRAGKCPAPSWIKTEKTLAD